MLFKVTPLDNGRTRRQARLKAKKIEEKKQKKIKAKKFYENAAKNKIKKEKNERKLESLYPKNRKDYGIQETEANKKRLLNGGKGVAKVIDVTKALQLRINKRMTLTDIGKYFDCCAQTVSNHLKPYMNIIANPADLKAFNSHKGELLDSIELKLLNTVADEEKLEKANLHQCASALNIISGIGRLEKGLSTENIAFSDMSESLEKLQQRKRQLQETLGIEEE